MRMTMSLSQSGLCSELKAQQTVALHRAMVSLSTIPSTIHSFYAQGSFGWLVGFKTGFLIALAVLELLPKEVLLVYVLVLRPSYPVLNDAS